MKTLKDVKVGESTVVVKLHGVVVAGVSVGTAFNTPVGSPCGAVFRAEILRILLFIKECVTLS